MATDDSSGGCFGRHSGTIPSHRVRVCVPLLSKSNFLRMCVTCGNDFRLVARSKQFIFFEIAAKFENYAMEMFQVEVRSRLRITAKRSEYVMGDLDGGLGSKLGWGSQKN